MRLVLWNVRSLRDDGAAVAKVLRDLDPDVVLLTEAPRLALTWWWPVRRLARLSGLRPVPAGRPDCGLLALVRPGTRVENFDRRRLLPEPGLHRRAALRLAIRISAGDRLSLLLTHLDVDPGARLRHAVELLALGEQLDIIAGDLNEEPAGPAWRTLAEGRVAVRTGPTFPARAPRRRIDAVLVGPAWRATSVPVDDPRLTAASDHLPVAADLTPSG